MVHVETPFQLLYVSQLAPGCDFGVVKEIVSVSRQRNPERGITGALLFDGERFCQLIEGAEADVQALMGHIARDPRHTEVSVLFAGQCLAGRAMRRWTSGYCDASELDALAGDAALHDRSALNEFFSVLRRADVV